MPLKADPYDILGVPRQAGLDEVRQAFRQLALACHPDLHPQQGREAEQKFCALVEAYQVVLEDLARNTPGKAQIETGPMTPQEYALLDTSWLMGSAGSSYTTDKRPDNQDAIRVPMVTQDENRLFIWAWVIATVATCIGIILLGDIHSAGTLAGALGPGWVFALSIGAYILLIAATLLAILLTRKVIYLVLANMRRRALPGPKNAAFPMPPPPHEAIVAPAPDEAPAVPKDR